MTVTANSGPYVAFGRSQGTSSTYQADNNPQMGPSVYFQGVGVYDDRRYYSYKPGQGATTPITGWWGNDRIMVIDQVPTTAGENTIAQTQSSTTATTRTLTLTATDTTNATVGVSIVAPETGQTVTGLIAIDGAADVVTYGSDATINMWNPTTMISRCVRIEGSSDDSGGGFTIYGRDVYGYLMSETLTGSISTTAGSTFVVTQKAFKYISTITASGTINSTGVTIGVADIYGFPLAVPNGSRVLIGISSGTQFSTVTASTGITAASTIATQTSTTPDVRGTWSSTTVADGTRRYTIYVSPSAGALESSGLFGAAQNSSVTGGF